VIVAIGVRPEIGLARAAGLAIGERGGIEVDEFNRTSTKNIYAIGMRRRRLTPSTDRPC